MTKLTFEAFDTSLRESVEPSVYAQTTEESRRLAFDGIKNALETTQSQIKHGPGR